jgi:peptide/nickel transport system substrate-binding protein
MGSVKRRFSMAALAVVAVASGVTIAGTAATARGTAKAAGTPAQPTVGAIPATEVQAPTCKKSTGTINYGIAGQGVNNLDASTNSNAPQSVMFPLVYPGLVQIQPDGSMRPDIATKWKSSADQKTWWFWIKRNVRYSTGRPLTSADVVQVYLHDLSPTVASISKTFINDIRSVRALGKYEVRFKLGSSSSIFPDQIFQAYMVDMSNPTALATSGVGAGPYKVASYVPNSLLSLVPNPYYFGPKPCVAKINIIGEPDPTSMVTAFTNGTLNMIWQVPTTDINQIQAIPTAKFIAPRSVSSIHVMLTDMSSAPFNNPLAREALSYAIDRKAMVTAALDGVGNTANANSILSTSSTAYDKALPAQAFNLQKAQQLFAQAGVAQGTTFTFLAQSGKRPEWITMGEILQQDLQKIGFNLNIVQKDPASYQASFLPVGKQYPNTIIADFLSLQPNPILGLQFALAGKCECNWNNTTGTQLQQYNQYNSLISAARAQSDPTKRQAIINQLQTMFTQVDPFMVIASQSNLVAQSKSITGAWVDPRGNTHLEDAQIAS